MKKGERHGYSSSVAKCHLKSQWDCSFWKYSSLLCTPLPSSEWAELSCGPLPWVLGHLSVHLAPLFSVKRGWNHPYSECRCEFQMRWSMQYTQQSVPSADHTIGLEELWHKNLVKERSLWCHILFLSPRAAWHQLLHLRRGICSAQKDFALLSNNDDHIIKP